MTHTYATAATQYIQAGVTCYAYRRMGGESGVPLIFLQNFRRGMDSTDPLLLDGFAEDRPVIIFDNAGVTGSSGETPDTSEALADQRQSADANDEIPDRYSGRLPKRGA